jgi:hypothetical protein
MGSYGFSSYRCKFHSVLSYCDLDKTQEITQYFSVCGDLLTGLKRALVWRKFHGCCVPTAAGRKGPGTSFCSQCSSVPRFLCWLLVWVRGTYWSHPRPLCLDPSVSLWQGRFLIKLGGVHTYLQLLYPLGDFSPSLICAPFFIPDINIGLNLLSWKWVLPLTLAFGFFGMSSSLLLLCVCVSLLTRWVSCRQQMVGLVFTPSS